MQEFPGCFQTAERKEDLHVEKGGRKCCKVNVTDTVEQSLLEKLIVTPPFMKEARARLWSL